MELKGCKQDFWSTKRKKPSFRVLCFFSPEVGRPLGEWMNETLTWSQKHLGTIDNVVSLFLKSTWENSFKEVCEMKGDGTVSWVSTKKGRNHVIQALPSITIFAFFYTFFTLNFFLLVLCILWKNFHLIRNYYSANWVKKH